MNTRNILVTLTALTVAASNATIPPKSPNFSSPLYKKIVSLDACLTDACNRNNEHEIGSFFSDNLLFYRDNQPSPLDKRAFIGEMKRTVLGQARREVVMGSIHVYPVKGYGAMEIGLQRFAGGHTKLGAAGKFVMLWRNEGGNWKVTQIVNFTTVLASGV
jgi:Domain of unknown function (DUF4440)